MPGVTVQRPRAPSPAPPAAATTLWGQSPGGCWLFGWSLCSDPGIIRVAAAEDVGGPPPLCSSGLQRLVIKKAKIS